MPPSRPPSHDPFTTSTTSTSHTLRAQPSHPSLRTTASAASTKSHSRTRQQLRGAGDILFPPNISRRPNSRTRVSDEVLADSSSEPEPRSRRRQQQHKSRQQIAEEQDIVKRDAQGNYVLGGGCEIGVGGVGVSAVKAVLEEDEEEERVREVNAYYSGLARKYFTSGAGMTTRRIDEDYERDRADMMYCLKAEVIQKLESEKWLYEPGDRLHPGIP